MLNKFLSISIFALLFFVPAFSYAAGIGATVEPLGRGKVSAGLIDNMVFNKSYETDSNVTKDKIDEKNETYIKLSLGVTEFANVYGLIGGLSEAKFKADWSDGTSNQIETDSGFLWGGGLGIVYSLEDLFFIGLDTHYLSWNADVDSVIETGTRASNISGDYTYYEAQTSVYIAKRINTIFEKTKLSFIPYIGGIYQYSKYDLGVSYRAGGTLYNISMQDFENDDKLGIMLGTDVEFEDFFRLNIEARAISEQALTVGTSLKF